MQAVISLNRSSHVWTITITNKKFDAEISMIKTIVVWVWHWNWNSRNLNKPLKPAAHQRIGPTSPHSLHILKKGFDHEAKSSAVCNLCSIKLSHLLSGNNFNALLETEFQSQKRVAAEPSVTVLRARWGQAKPRAVSRQNTFEHTNKFSANRSNPGSLQL